MSNDDNKNITRLGSLLVITAPSGAGKSTLVKRLREAVETVAFSISYTTRPPRAGEENGREYFFVTVPEFEKMQEDNQFLEWAKVHNNYYGTNRKTIEQALASGKDIILDIDVQGAEQIKQAMPQAVLIFIMPPSFNELSERLRSRNLDNLEVIERRLKGATKEVSCYSTFDYIIINDELEVATAALIAITKAERLRPARNEARLKIILDTFPKD